MQTIHFHLTRSSGVTENYEVGEFANLTEAYSRALQLLRASLAENKREGNQDSPYFVKIENADGTTMMTVAAAEAEIIEETHQTEGGN